MLFFNGVGGPLYLNGLTHSYPTRPSSELGRQRQPGGRPPARPPIPPGNRPFRTGPAAPIARAPASLALFSYGKAAPARLTSGRGQSAGESERSEEHTSELQSLMRPSYAVFCL